MRQIIYGDMVRTLAKSGEAILKTLTPVKCHVWHMVSCIMGESGEAFDGTKKWLIYGQPLSKEAVLEELGDCEFYLEGLRQGLSEALGEPITRQMCLDHNATKLAKRYGDKFLYSDKAAQERADKQPGQQAAPEREYTTLS